MKLPWVSREAYDERGRTIQMQAQRIFELVDRNDALVKTIVEMRKDGFAAAKPGRVREAPDPETQAKHRAENVFVTNARTAMIDQLGVDPVTAQREAERLRAEATDQHPGGG